MIPASDHKTSIAELQSSASGRQKDKQKRRGEPLIASLLLVVRPGDSSVLAPSSDA